jgi:hypothetical protein
VADGVEESLLESMLPTHTGVGEEGGGRGRGRDLQTTREWRGRGERPVRNVWIWQRRRR